MPRLDFRLDPSSLMKDRLVSVGAWGFLQLGVVGWCSYRYSCVGGSKLGRGRRIDCAGLQFRGSIGRVGCLGWLTRDCRTLILGGGHLDSLKYADLDLELADVNDCVASTDLHCFLELVERQGRFVVSAPA